MKLVLGNKYDLPHGRGTLIGYEYFSPDGRKAMQDYSSVAPESSKYRHIFKLDKGHTWLFDGEYYVWTKQLEELNK